MFELKDVPSSAFALKTNGAKILSIELVNAKGEELQFYKVLGQILPIDPNCPVINVEINIPLKWNSKLVHFGGGGFNGYLITGLGAAPGEKTISKTPLELGFATCGSDSGHVNKSFWDMAWALNNECLMNFGHEHIKKTKDMAFYVIKEITGGLPRKTFFAGSSNGGREALMCAQRYPKDYDGILVGYPVYNWVAKILTDFRNMKAMDDAGEEGFISEEDFIAAYELLQKFLEQKGCMHDGLALDLAACDELKEEAFLRLEKALNKKQIAVLKNFYQPMDFSYELSNGVKHQEGFGIVQQICDHKIHPFGRVPGKRDGLFAKTVDQIIRYQILKDENADVKAFDYTEHKEEVLKLSKVMDATDAKLDEFCSRGAKILMFHGTNDQLLSVYASIDYFQKVVEHLGKDVADNFIKLFLVPGFGHDYGEVFDMHASLLELLDKWVETNIAPKEFEAVDLNKATYGRKQIIKAYK